MTVTDPALIHETLFYRNEEEFLSGLVTFVASGAEAGGPVFALLSLSKFARGAGCSG